MMHSRDSAIIIIESQARACFYEDICIATGDKRSYFHVHFRYHVQSPLSANILNASNALRARHLY